MLPRSSERIKQRTLGASAAAAKRLRRCSADSGVSAPSAPNSSDDQSSLIDVVCDGSSPAISVGSTSPPPAPLSRAARTTPSPRRRPPVFVPVVLPAIGATSAQCSWRDTSLWRDGSSGTSTSSDSGVGTSAGGSPCCTSARPTPPPFPQAAQVSPSAASTTGVRQSKPSSASSLQCSWLSCSYRGDDDDATFDHVIAEHVRPFDPEHTRRPGRGRKPPRGTYDCRWVGCRKFGHYKARGTDRHKYDWLLEHVTQYHSGRARPFACIISSCARRFGTRGAQATHVAQCTAAQQQQQQRRQSTAAGGNGAARSNGGRKRRPHAHRHSVCFVRPIDASTDYLDDKFVDILAYRLLAGLPPVKFDRPTANVVVGARKRKCRSLPDRRP